MSNVMAAQVNSGYVEVPYRNLRRRTFLRALIQSAVETLGRGEKGFGWGFDTFERKYSASRSTVWRTVKELKADERFEVGRMGKASGELRYKGELDHDTHIHVENWFNTQVFKFTYKDKQGNVVGTEERTLKPSEVALFSLIYTHWNDTNYFRATYQKIAGLLCLSVETVCRDVRALLAAKLIARPKVKKMKGRQCNFTVRKQTFDFYAKPILEQKKAQAEQKAPKEQSDKAKKAKYIIDINTRALRQSYYQNLENEREDKAERYGKAVYAQVPRFKDLSDKLRDAELAAAKAVGSDAALLEVKVETLRKKRLEMAKAYKIVFERFEPEYYGQNQCSKCKGTGYHQNGIACDCWKASKEKT